MFCSTAAPKVCYDADTVLYMIQYALAHLPQKLFRQGKQGITYETFTSLIRRALAIFQNYALFPVYQYRFQ